MHVETKFLCAFADFCLQRMFISVIYMQSVSIFACDSFAYSVALIRKQMKMELVNLFTNERRRQPFMLFFVSLLQILKNLFTCYGARTASIFVDRAIILNLLNHNKTNLL